MFEALLQLREPLSKMNLSVGCPRLSELDWWVLKVGEEVLRPLMLVMVELEGQKYVTTSFVIPMVEAIREGLNESNDLYMYIQTNTLLSHVSHFGYTGG